MNKKKRIINNINVNDCKLLHGDYCELYEEFEFLRHCKDHSDCDYKQLQHKIAECNEYKQALNEIEEQCKCFGRSRYTQEFDREYGGELDTNILDIINKLKDDNNAR